MPELAELDAAARTISACGAVRRFARASYSAVAKGAPLALPAAWRAFRVRAESRGKELCVWLRDDGAGGAARKQRGAGAAPGEEVAVLFHHGMSGCWEVTPSDAVPKHAHLRLHSADDDCVLSFVDVRRFGSWEPAPAKTQVSKGSAQRVRPWPWSESRGPCPVKEFDAFVSHLRKSADSVSLFVKPLAEVIMDQRYFNGVGNYLRAEIIHRAGVSPFTSAREALASAFAKLDSGDSHNLVSLCSAVPREVIELRLGDDYKSGRSGNGFRDWLQCYSKARAALDPAGRTLWYSYSGTLPKGYKAVVRAARGGTKRPSTASDAERTSTLIKPAANEIPGVAGEPTTHSSRVASKRVKAVAASDAPKNLSSKPPGGRLRGKAAQSRAVADIDPPQAALKTRRSARLRASSKGVAMLDSNAAETHLAEDTSQTPQRARTRSVKKAKSVRNTRSSRR